MKSILICSHWMEIGGAERALLGLLESIDCTKYEVDLYLCRHTGEFMSLIPDKINLLPEDSSAAAIAIPMKKALIGGKIFIVAGRLWAKIRAKLYLTDQTFHGSCVAIEYSNKYTYRFVKQINPSKEYDLLVSFLEPHYIAANKARAKKKIAWMHTDYQAIAVDAKQGLKIWEEFNWIAAISEDCKTNFSRIYPTLQNRIVLIENILSKTLVQKQSKEEISENALDHSAKRLLSIGRFSSPKNFDNVPDICRRIRDEGIDVKWYIIGYGGDEDLIRTRIKESGMEEHVIILGKQTNPYKYINDCDVYVQPSRYEGKCVAVREAQMLGRPVVITNYATSSSQLEDGVDGVIVPMDNEGCAAGIAALLRDPQKMAQLSENCLKRDYSNATEVEKLYQLMEE